MCIYIIIPVLRKCDIHALNCLVYKSKNQSFSCFFFLRCCAGGGVCGDISSEGYGVAGCSAGAFRKFAYQV